MIVFDIDTPSSKDSLAEARGFENANANEEL